MSVTDINFWSQKNYMKRDTSTGMSNFAAPSVASGGNFVTRVTVPYNLGIIPLIRVSYEPFADGVLYPALGSRLDGSAVNPRNTSLKGPYLLAWPSLTALTIELGYDANTLTGTFPVYWVIYRDYGLS